MSSQEKQNKICQNCKVSFEIAPEDFEFYTKIKVPPPTFCSRCRAVRRFLFRNDKVLYKRKCQVPGHTEDVISTYSPDSKHTVYDLEYWWSDGWDPKSYAKDYDFKRPFFEQWHELFLEVPHPNVWCYGLNNSPYTNYCGNGETIYLCAGVFDSKNCSYSYYGNDNELVYDSYNMNESEESYELINSSKIFKSTFVLGSREVFSSHYIFDCVNCQNCFMSSNLRNKNYVFRNKQLSKEEYMEQIKKINRGNRAEADIFLDEYKNLILNSIHKYADIKQSTNSTGDGIASSVNAKNSFVAYNCENIANTWRTMGLKDSREISGLGYSEQCYEAVVSGVNNAGERFTMFMGTNNDVEYSAYCFGSSHLFGCVGLKKSEYCIFNKQYDKESYFKLRDEIIKHMMEFPYIDINGHTYSYGEFFPPSMSAFNFNESFAPDFYFVDEEEAKRKNYNINKNSHAIYQETCDTPLNISDLDKGSINEIFPCLTWKNNSECRKAFKIVDSELEFYQRNMIAFPRYCPSCRLLKRLTYTQGVILTFSNCIKCNTLLETPYPKNAAVYCESCYNKEVL